MKVGPCSDVIMAAFRVKMPLDDILTIFGHMHYDQMYASAEAYTLALTGVTDKVKLL